MYPTDGLIPSVVSGDVLMCGASLATSVPALSRQYFELRHFSQIVEFVPERTNRT